MISESTFAAVFGAAVAGGDDSLVHLSRAAVRAGFAVVPCLPGTKQPMCTLAAREVNKADAAAQEEARIAGKKRWEKARHACGIHHAITDPKESDRVIKRLVRDYGRINLGIEPGRSKILIVDVDTAAEKAAFESSWRANDPDTPIPPYTVASPGVQDAAGNWVHRDGGHYYFALPERMVDWLAEHEPGAVKVENSSGTGWSAVWKDRQVLVPPSARREGAYRLVGDVYAPPAWLLRVVISHVKTWTERAVAQKQRRAAALEAADGTVPAIDQWSAATPWSKLLEADGWTETGDVTTCGCPEWTAPGFHASPKSATAHEEGCSEYDDSPGHCPLYIWTDNPPEPLEGHKAYTKIQYLAATRHGSTSTAAVRAACREEGIAAEGGVSSALVSLGNSLLEARRAEVNGHAVVEQIASTDPLPHGESDEAPHGTDSPVSAPGAFTPIDLPSAPPVPGTAPPVFDPYEGLTPAEKSALDERAGKLHADQRIQDLFGDEIFALEKARAKMRLRATEEARAEHMAEKDGSGFDDELYDEADIEDMPDLEPLIDGWIYRDSDVRIYGPSGHGKSFFVLDWAMSVANGVSWDGNEVHQGKVLYVAAEGARGVKKRIKAWRKKHGGSPKRGQFTIKGKPIQLAAPDQLIEAASENQYALVILDTQARVTVGLEENSATDHATITEAMRKIREAAGGATVILVHHSGKDEDAGARGSSAGTAAMDTEIRVAKKNTLITASIDKQKDEAGGLERTFALSVVPETGSCVLLPMDPLSAGMADTGAPGGLTPLGVASSGGRKLPTGKMVPEVVALYRELYELDPTGGLTKAEIRTAVNLGVTGRATKDKNRAAANRAFSMLRNEGFIVPADENVTGREEGKYRWRGPEDGEISPTEREKDSGSVSE